MFENFNLLCHRIQISCTVHMWSHKKTIKQNQIKAGLLFAELIIDPLKRKELHFRADLNSISKTFETDCGNCLDIFRCANKDDGNVRMMKIIGIVVINHALVLNRTGMLFRLCKRILKRFVFVNF